MRRACTLLILFSLICAAARSQNQFTRVHVIPGLANVSGQGADAAQSSSNTSDDPYHPRSESIPTWAQQGDFHFARLDGGPIEPKKTSNSHWGKTFTESDREVLGNLYGKYGDRAADLITQADVNWVRLTWSVGYMAGGSKPAGTGERNARPITPPRNPCDRVYVCIEYFLAEYVVRDDPQSVTWLSLSNETEYLIVTRVGQIRSGLWQM